jgi:hypothetical protein
MKLRIDITRGDAHPRVIGCTAEFKGFVSIQKDTALETTPERKDKAYYAVAHGANPGIREFW